MINHHEINIVLYHIEMYNTHKKDAEKTAVNYILQMHQSILQILSKQYINIQQHKVK